MQNSLTYEEMLFWVWILFRERNIQTLIKLIEVKEKV